MDFLLADDNKVLEYVDEYTLYCHYLEYEPEIKINYVSPLRADDDSPSFGIYPTRYKNREYFWKDSGGKGDSGDIFKLVKLLYGYQNIQEAVARVKSDFGLGITVPHREKIIRNRAPERSDIDIRVRPRDFKEEDLQFWKQFNITEDILKRYRTSPLYCYWFHPRQSAPYFAPKKSYVYRIYDRYQLYFPENPKNRKFRNDLLDTHVMGMQQLQYSSDTLIITKSYKDVMCLTSLNAGIEAVSPRSENTPMPEGAFDFFNSRYKKIYVLFDNDMKHRGDWYPYPKIYIPEETGCKDISDFTRDYDASAAYELVRQIAA